MTHTETQAVVLEFLKGNSGKFHKPADIAFYLTCGPMEVGKALSVLSEKGLAYYTYDRWGEKRIWRITQKGKDTEVI